MKILGIVLFCIIVVGLTFTGAYAVKKITPEERGRAFFRDANFADSKKSCDSCHPNGRGLEKAGGKKTFRIMGKRQNSIEEAVNFCITRASKGKAIGTRSREMKDIVTYIKSLMKIEVPGYGVPGYGVPGY
jgi:cytochrome c